MTPLKNDLLLRALRGEPVPRPPVWMMRQAGRYLPQFRALRERYDFFTRVETPELAAEITLQPIDLMGVDAAIIFSDILVIPQALGITVTMDEGKGPRLSPVIRTPDDLAHLAMPDVADRLSYVYQALRLTQSGLAGRVPLIGFAGAPWTLLAYMVEGQGSKDYARAKAFLYQYPEAAHRLLTTITDLTVAYLNHQLRAGADLVQVFDSWAGLLSPADFATYSLPYLARLVAEVEGPVILFARGAWHSLAELAATGASALGVGSELTPAFARRQTEGSTTLQGNLDPALLYAPIPTIVRETRAMVEAFGAQRYIANLGHGILPDVPVDHARAFIETVQSYG